jgi:nicotinate phosphoribosyltransferase
MQAYCRSQIETLWDELLRFEYPQHYYVDLSDALWKLRADLIEAYQSAY